MKCCVYLQNVTQIFIQTFPIMKRIINALVFVLSLIVGMFIARFITDSIFWRWVIAMLFTLIVEFVIQYIKATKNPDVRTATSLGMSVNRYRQYRKWYDEWQDAMTKYGTDSKEANAVFDEFFPQIKNMNEWRRYQEFRFNEVRDHMFDSLNEMFK